MKWYNRISAKIIFCVAGMILVVNGALAFVYLRIQKEDLDVTVLRNASRLSETIKKSIRNERGTSTRCGGRSRGRPPSSGTCSISRGRRNRSASR